MISGGTIRVIKGDTRRLDLKYKYVLSLLALIITQISYDKMTQRESKGPGSQCLCRVPKARTTVILT